MRRTWLRITLSCTLLATAVYVWAQTRKPGLWDVTTTTTWQQSPMPAGTTMPAGAKSPFAGGTTTTQVCLTQAQIDKYGAILPQTRGDCQTTNIVVKSNSMTADMACTGTMSGKGTMESSWTDDEHATGKAHFLGSVQMGPNSKPVEWTSTSTSIFKSEDCGSVKPISK
jgi:hypothetical protein